MLKVLVVGDWQWPWYQEACAQALEGHGCSVVRFGWVDLFKHSVPGRSYPVFRSFWLRCQSRMQAGPAIWRLRRALVELATREQPDVVFFYNVQLVDRRTVVQLKQAIPRATFCQYANDNPFSAHASRGLWRHFLESLPEFHLHFAYRHTDLDNFKRCGAREVHLLRSYFIPKEDFPLEPAQRDPRFVSEVVFAGHYEDDDRVPALEAVIRAGYRLKLVGGGWNAAGPRLAPDSPIRRLLPTDHVAVADYRQVICGAKVALSFLSTLNRDTYTRRNFQIPAMNVPMLSTHTPDLAHLFSAEEEIAFFRTPAELVAKIGELLNNPERAKRIADGGQRRVWRDEHHVSGRMSQLLGILREARARGTAFNGVSR